MEYNCWCPFGEARQSLAESADGERVKPVFLGQREAGGSRRPPPKDGLASGRRRLEAIWGVPVLEWVAPHAAVTKERFQKFFRLRLTPPTDCGRMEGAPLYRVVLK